MSDASFLVVNLFSDLTKPWVVKPDWDVIVKVIDIVNEEPVAATKALAPRILEQLSDKDPKVVWLTLIVLDACMKHCPQEFVRTIAQQDFMTKLVAIIKKRWVKKSKGVSVKATYNNWCGQLAASVVQEWGIAFSKDNHFYFPIFTVTYRKLIQKGIVFPIPNSTAMPRFSFTKEEKATGHTKGGTMLRRSVKAGAEAEITQEVKRVIASAAEGDTLLNEIMNNLSKGEKIENNEVATQVATELENNFETISKLVPTNLDNEKALALLLAEHEKIEKNTQKVQDYKIRRCF